MPEIILTADKTVLINYRLTCLGGFVACVPRSSLPKVFTSYLERKIFLPTPTNEKGEAEIANLLLRKVETILLGKGFDVLVKNHIFPLATLVTGLPGEKEEDVWETICLIRELKEYPSLIMPLFFVPLGRLKESESFIEQNFTDIYKELYVTCFEHTAYWGRRFTSWGGKSLPLLAQWVVHVGTMLAFDYFKVLKERKKVSSSEWSFYLLKENAVFLASRIMTPQKMKVG